MTLYQALEFLAEYRFELSFREGEITFQSKLEDGIDFTPVWKRNEDDEEIMDTLKKCCFCLGKMLEKVHKNLVYGEKKVTVVAPVGWEVVVDKKIELGDKILDWGKLVETGEVYWIEVGKEEIGLWEFEYKVVIRKKE